MAKNTKNNKNQNYYKDLFFLILLPAIAAGLTLLLPLNLLESTLLYFGLPALYLSIRNSSVILRSLIFAATITVISISTDYFAERNLSWTSTSSFQFRLAGLVPIEALVWVFLFTYLITAYYQNYYVQSATRLIGKRMLYLFMAALAVLVWLGFGALVDIHSFVINYFYIKFGLLFFVLPLLAFVLFFPRFLKVFLQTAPYFFVLSLLNLIVSLQKGHWIYRGNQFIGWVHLGAYRFPIEELVFWMILYSSFVISQFEFYDNDLKLSK